MMSINLEIWPNLLQLSSIVIPLFCFLLLAQSAVCADKFYLGRFQGSGRACYGDLVVKEKTISWRTPFSLCKSSRYKLIEQKQTEEKKIVVFEKSKVNKGCYYKILELSHHIAESADIGWNVSAYTSLDAYNKKSSDRIDCYLFRIK